jgi:2-acylglycerol O-acyltransferase 2
MLENVLHAGDLFQTAAGGFFQVPFARNWFYMIGIIPADKHLIVDKLRKKNHVNFAVKPCLQIAL